MALNFPSTGLVAGVTTYTSGTKTWIWNGSAWDYKGMVISGTAPISYTNGAISLDSSGVTSGTYNNSATAITPFTVDSYGRLTATGSAVTITPAWSSISSTPTTLSGYGITNGLDTSSTAQTKSGNLTVSSIIKSGGTSSQFLKADGSVDSNTYLTTSSASSSYQPLDADLTAIAALTGTSGFLKKTAADTWSLDTSTYLTSAVTSITAGTGLSGGTITATGTIALATAYGDTVNPYASKTANYILAAPNGSAGVPTFRALVATDIPTLNQNTTGSAGSVANALSVGAALAFTSGTTFDGSAARTLNLTSVGTAGTYTQVTTDSYGRVTSGANPTTLSGYGITDALNTSATAQTKSGNLTAAQFIKSGGTSAQFLKADGSSDSNTYLTTGTATSTYAPINNPTFTGTVTLAADPTSALHAATKQYVDNAITGLDWHPAVNVLAVSNVPLTGSTPLTVDSHTLSNGYRLLLKGQTTGSENGIYDLTITGASYTLTRSTDADAYAELVGASVFVMEGTSYGSTAWIQTNTYLTSFASQTWVQFSGQGTYTAGNGLTLSTNSFSIDTSITVDKTTAQTLTNKTLTSPIISTISNTGTITLPTATDTLVGKATTDILTNKSISGSTNTLSNIANSSLTNSSITVNGSAISLGGSATITAVNPNALTIGTGLSGTSYTGGSAVTIAIDSTVATLSGTQTFTNKSLTDSTTYFQDETDNTKKLQFQLSGITTGTTRTLTIPDVSGSIITTGDTGTVTNTMLAGSIANTKLTNSSVTIGSTSVSLGATSTTLAGLTSVTSTSFVGALTGNADTVTNGVYTTGTYSNPAWITGLAWSKISTTPTTLSGYGITDALNTSATAQTKSGNLSLPIVIATGGDASNASIQATGYNQRGGVGYHGFLQVTNTYGSATNPSKHFRINSTGSLEILNSAYTTNIFALTDAGALAVPSNVTAGSFIKSGGTSSQYLMADGSTVTTGATTSMNYAQTQSTKQSAISTSGVTIVSASLTTGGNPVQILVTGDGENTAAGGWVKLQLFRGTTAIGKIIHLEGSASSENIPYALTVIDTPSAGTYTYSLQTVSTVSTGAFNFGETDGPVLTAIELNTLTPTINLTLSGTATADQFVSTNNGNGTNFKVGDDSWIGDINTANTLGIKGQQSASSGYIKFGSDTNTFGYNGTNLVYGSTIIPSSATLLTSTTGVTTVNGSSGAISNIAVTNSNNNFSAAQTITGALTATSIVKSGGASTEFLKADGSVDTSSYATTTYVDNSIATEGEITPLDDLSNYFNGIENRFMPTYQGSQITIQNPYRLLLTINGIIQYIDSPDYVWMSGISRRGFMVDSDGYLAFSEPVPEGSEFDGRLMSGAATTTKTRTYPFRALDIILGG